MYRRIGMPTNYEKWGFSHTGNECDPYEVEIDYGNLGKRKGVVRTNPSPGIPGLDEKYAQTGKDYVVVDVEHSGWVSRALIHLSRIFK
jgi:hypothetical protein